MKARTRKAATMASSLDPIIGAIIAVAGRTVNTRPRGPCLHRREPTRTKLSESSQKRYLHDAQENHTPGPARRGGKNRKWGKVGPNQQIGPANQYASEGILRAAKARAQRQELPV